MWWALTDWRGHRLVDDERRCRIILRLSCWPLHVCLFVFKLFAHSTGHKFRRPTHNTQKQETTCVHPAAAQRLSPYDALILQRCTPSEGRVGKDHWKTAISSSFLALGGFRTGSCPEIRNSIPNFKEVSRGGAISCELEHKQRLLSRGLQF